MTPEKALERSVDSLQRIYTVIVALAVASAIKSLTIEKATDNLLTLGVILAGLPVFLSFLVTLIPFYHGMNRHLDNCYMPGGNVAARGAILFDFVVFLTESVMLFGVASSVRESKVAFACLALLLGMDSVWAIASHFIHYRHLNPSVIRWACLNALAIPVGVGVFFLNVWPDNIKTWLVFAVAFLRSILDYIIAWDFYFPPLPADVSRPVS